MHFRFKSTIAGMALLGASASPSFASEIVYTPFDLAHGVATTGVYDGTVSITVSGLGQALASLYSDAFYVLDHTPTDYHQWDLGFATSGAGLTSAENFLVGPVPAFDPTSIYTFELNTGLQAPAHLYFGVSDEIYTDNSGAYTVVVTQLASAVPEPSTWAMLLMGFIGLGFAGYRKQEKLRASPSSYAPTPTMSRGL